MILSIFFSEPSKVQYFILFLRFVVHVGYVGGENATNNYLEESMITESSENQGRYLVFPTPGSFVPTKVQLIAGLGLPMEVDVSMIVGYVVKFNYALPYNASYLTQPYAVRYDRSIDPRSIFDRGAKEEEEGEEKAAKQMKEDRRGSSSRWQMYRVIEWALEGFQVSGKGCLLKTVCQVAEVPFANPRSGLVAQLIHVLLTPSTTSEKYEFSGDQEYYSAEAAGRKNPGSCEKLFPECRDNLLEYFTEINYDQER